MPSENNDQAQQQQSQQENQQQQPQRPESRLLSDRFFPLGTFIFTELRRIYSHDLYAFRVLEYAYICYLQKHPEANTQFVEEFNQHGHEAAFDFVKNIGVSMEGHIKYFTIKVNHTPTETRETITRISQSPTYRQRDLTVDVIDQNFDCDENDLKQMRDYMAQINAYTGSMLSVGKDEEENTVLIIHIFSIE